MGILWHSVGELCINHDKKILSPFHSKHVNLLPRFMVVFDYLISAL